MDDVDLFNIVTQHPSSDDNYRRMFTDLIRIDCMTGSHCWLVAHTWKLA